MGLPEIGTGCARWALAWGLSALAIGCDDGAREGTPSGDTQALLSGRVFSVDEGSPLEHAKVRVGEDTTETLDGGAFKIRYEVSAAHKQTVHVVGSKHAPVTKLAPDGDGYLEVFAKQLDAQKDIDPGAGGEVTSPRGAALKLPPGALQRADGSTPKDAKLSLAVPELAKGKALGALPGDFGAESAGKKGKLSVESSVYVSAGEGETQLALRKGKTATIALPSSPGSKKSTQQTLYRFDTDESLWREVGPLRQSLLAEDQTVFEGEVTAFGWYAVGTLIDALSCIRACVVRDGEPVPFAHAVATGLDQTTQASTFAGSDGCFVLELPASARFVMSVQSQAAYASSFVFESGASGDVTDPSACGALATIFLDVADNSDAPCAREAELCGGTCVDVSNHPDHCGACDQACTRGEECIAGACLDASDPTPTMDAGVPSADAGTMEDMDAGTRDAEPIPTMDAGVPSGDAGTMEDMDAGTRDAEAIDASAPDSSDLPDASFVLNCVSDPGCESDLGGCFVRVPGSEALGTSDFCISRFEMKRVNDVAWSMPAGQPWELGSQAQAASACAALGAEFSLPSNAQWQSLARDIEGVPDNWSGGQVDDGVLARGHVDTSPSTPLSVANPDDPCDQSVADGCTTPGHPTFSQRRTHWLSNGGEIWDVGGNVAEWVGNGDLTSFFANFAINASLAPPEIQEAIGPQGSYTSAVTPMLSSAYPSNALVEPGALAVVEGQNFASGTIWVRAGGTLFIRGSNFEGNVYLEPNAAWVNSGSNINVTTGSIVRSADTMVTGHMGSQVTIAEGSYAECGGTCPAGVQRFTADDSRGLGWLLSFSSSTVTSRGGKVGLGPLGGVFTAGSSNTFGGPVGFRCVKAPSP